MEKFRFYQDIMISVWQRQHFTIEAESEEEAMKKAMKYRNEDVSGDCNSVDTEYLTETELMINPEDNQGQATIELYKLGAKEPFATNVDDTEQYLAVNKTAHEVAYREMAGYTAECTYGENNVFYQAWHKDNKLHVAVLKPEDVAQIYCFPCHWSELVKNNTRFRTQMTQYLNRKYNTIQQRNEIIDWLNGHLTRMTASSDAVDDAVPFTLKDLIDAAGDMASVMNCQPAPLVGYQIVGKENALPEGLYSSQIIRDKNTAFRILANARIEQPDKNFQIYPVYEGEIEEPQYR